MEHSGGRGVREGWGGGGGGGIDVNVLHPVNL